MRGVYNCPFTVASVTTGDVFSIEAPASEVVELHSVRVKVQNPVAGEDFDMQMIRCSVNPTGGATQTIKPTEPGDQASGCTVREKPTGETKEAQEFGRDAFPAEVGWIYAPTPEERDHIEAGGAVVFELLTTITSATLIVSAKWREIG